jgi:cold shock CspA family protein
MSIFEPRKDGKPLTQETPESVAREKAEKEKRIKGKIIRVDPKGYGFIISNELPFERIFFHWSSLRNNTVRFPELRRGMTVEFVARDQGKDEATGENKGFKAIRIIVVSKEIDTSDLEDDDDESGSTEPAR